MSNRTNRNFGVGRGISRREETERRLREAEARYRALVERVPAVTYVGTVGEFNSAVYVSPQVEVMLGYAPEEWLVDPRFFAKLLHPDDRERVLSERERSNETGEPFSMEYRLTARDGRAVWVRDDAALVRDERGRPLFWQGMMTDLTERKALEERLRHQALHDPLTGLPNCGSLLDRLGEALARRRGSKVAVLFMDLDNFKHVNDSLGHEAGDRLLGQVAGRIGGCLRAEDTIGRIGGDEFVVLVEDLEEDGAAKVARRIARALLPPIPLDGREVFATASIGVAIGSSGEDHPEALLRDAGAAMYRAKEGGKDRYVALRRELRERSSKRLGLERDLRRALQRGEFLVHYQPQVVMETGEIVGVEALVRWEHPERGLLHPAEFVPLAEETGLIVPLGRWVLEEACHQVKEWQVRHPGDPALTVCVNVSTRQLHDPGLVGEVARVLHDTAVEASSLVLEITEGAAVEDAPSSIATLHALKELGVRLAIDDFGTGYTSLSYLKRFPVDVLKLDRSIVEGLGKARCDSAILSAAIALAHALGLDVIAEGMETGEEVAELCDLGCDLGQGYYWWRPRPAEEMAVLLGTHRNS